MTRARKGSGRLRITVPRTGPARCCIARSGLMKARYRSLQRAEEKAYRVSALRGVHVEPYECQHVPGTFHLRRVRTEETPA